MLIGSACKDMMLVAVDGEGQNIKLCCCVRRVAADVSKYLMYISSSSVILASDASGIVYHQFNIQQLCVLSKLCVYVFCGSGTNSDYFTIQHYLTGFYNKEWVFLLRGADKFTLRICLQVYMYLSLVSCRLQIVDTS